MNIETLILAAGKGTRMRSENLPKVMHEISGYPVIGWIMEAVKPFSELCHIVVGHKKEVLIDFISKNYPGTVFSEQIEQNGTGGAVISAVSKRNAAATHTLIIAGDMPLIKTETLQKTIESFTADNADMTVITTMLDDPGAYGRVKTDKNGCVQKIVEYLDATAQEREIKEINSGIYFVKSDFLYNALPKLKNSNAKGEFYLTDVIEIIFDSGGRVTRYLETDSYSMSGINNRKELADADKVMQKKIRNETMLSGVTLISPKTIYIEKGAQIGIDSVIQPNCFIGRKARIGVSCNIGANSVILGDVSDGCEVGPLSIN